MTPLTPFTKSNSKWITDINVNDDRKARYLKQDTKSTNLKGKMINWNI